MRMPRRLRAMIEQRRADARHRAGIPAANERARRQTRAAYTETGGDWGDGRWERTRWVNGAPVRTYRGRHQRTRSRASR
jgi:hypothetical protein